jgi:hypothetical protein
MSDQKDDANLKKLLLDFVRDEKISKLSDEDRYRYLIGLLKGNPDAFSELKAKMAEMGHDVQKMKTFESLKTN